jgi:TatD DNase family protein
MPLFDTHCHLGLDGSDATAAHGRAVAVGVERMVVVGIDLASSERARQLAAKLPGVSWSAGLHPNDAGRFADEWPALAALAATPGIAAIGETGLDCFRDRCPLEQQHDSLRRHVQLANELELPVILHCRDAFAPLFENLRGLRPHRGVMHCFSGTIADARQALDLGLMISFAGPLTYPKNDVLRQVCAFVPAASLLIETDAPFLPPQSHRGKRNEPALIAETLRALAGARGWDEAHAAEVTFGNARNLFGD